VSLTAYVKEFNMGRLPAFKKYRTSKLLNLRKKYRSDFEIIALMLEAMKNDAAPRFSIMKYTSVNSAQLKKFLGSLIEMGFIEMNIKADRVLYRTSEKGLAFLRHYYVLLGMLLGAYVEETRPALRMKHGNTFNAQEHSKAQILTNLQRTP
jgi:predicted transcriptional regulator